MCHNYVIESDAAERAPFFNFAFGVYLSPIFGGPGIRTYNFVRHTGGFPFCQRLWDLTKRQDDIVVANMVADMVADMEVHMVADTEGDKVADMVADMAADFVYFLFLADMLFDMVGDMEVDKVADMVAGININMEIQFGERVGHGDWLQNFSDPNPTRLACLLSFVSLFLVRKYCHIWYSKLWPVVTRRKLVAFVFANGLRLLVGQTHPS